MNHQSLTPHDATGLLSLVGLVVLFIGLLLLIRRTQQKRLQQAQAAPAAAAKPFPQNLEARLQILPDSGEQRQERLAQLRQAYADWQSAYWLRGLDGATEFLRGQTTKRGLRYQISATSLVQGLAMLIQTQMAEKDDDSRAGFERLLACLLSRPAQDFPALSSWLFMPDLPTSPRLQSDLHAEAWILSALLAAERQWGSLERIDLNQVLAERARALPDALRNESEEDSAVFSPFLYRIIARGFPDPIWHSRADADWKALVPRLRVGKGLPARQEALSMLQIGLEGILQPDGDFPQWSDLAFARLKRALASLGELDGEVEEGFSRLASFCCCVPLAAADKNGGWAEGLWSRLVQAQAARQDALGASLRLLAMMILAETFWLGESEAPVTQEV